MSQPIHMPIIAGAPRGCSCDGRRCYEEDGAEGAPVPKTETDVLVIGGGIAGACSAYHLACTGIKVTLVDRVRAGEGGTPQAVGVLSPPLRQSYHLIAHDYGAEAAKELWDFSLRSVDGLADLLQKEGAANTAELDRSGGHVLAERHTADVVSGAYRAMKRDGLPVRWLDADAVRDVTQGRGFCGGYVLEGGGAVDPIRATGTVLRAAEVAGASVLQDTCVFDVSPSSGGFRAVMGTQEIQARAVVHAGDVGGAELFGDLGAQIVSMRAQAFVTAPLPIQFHGAFTTDWKANVWRQRPDGRIVMSGWRHHAFNRSYRQGPAIDHGVQQELRAWFETSFPHLAPLPIEREWSGVLGWTPDLLPLVGAIPGRSGEWAVTGFGGSGLAFAFEAGRAVAHAIVGDVPLQGARLLAPARLSGAYRA